MSAPAQLDRIFAALSDPTRRAILRRLAKGDATVSELSRPFSISAPAISRHLRVLEAASVIRQEREGQYRRCRLDPAGLAIAAQWLDSYRPFWSENLDRLDEHLSGTAAPTGRAKTQGPAQRKRKAR
jgi:DNA-binding transcriptional ArsR family regulator